MNDGQRKNTLLTINKWIKSTGVESVWDLPKIVKKTPPIFKFDYEIVYAILGLLSRTSISVPLPVMVNKRAIAEVYKVSVKNVEEHFNWLCKVGILKKS